MLIKDLIFRTIPQFFHERHVRVEILKLIKSASGSTTITSSQISDASTIGKSLLTSPDAATALSDLGGASEADLALKADKTITISVGTGLAGGGDLSANRTLALNAASIVSLAKADTAVQPGETTYENVLTNSGITQSNTTILIKNSSGAIVENSFSSLASANTIAYRDANSNIKVGTAIATADAVNLQVLNNATKSKAAIVALTTLDPAADLPTAVAAINSIIAALKA